VRIGEREDFLVALLQLGRVDHFVLEPERARRPLASATMARANRLVGRPA